MADPFPDDETLSQLSAVRVAKDLFLSQWYEDACEALFFDERACATFAEIAEESRAEREALLRVAHRWSETRARSGADRARHVPRFTRVEFLQTLMTAKDASGEVVEKLALLAPPQFRDELFRLAAIDFRHATRLRTLLEREIDTIVQATEASSRAGRIPEQEESDAAGSPTPRE